LIIVYLLDCRLSKVRQLLWNIGILLIPCKLAIYWTPQITNNTWLIFFFGLKAKLRWIKNFWQTNKDKYLARKHASINLSLHCYQHAMHLVVFLNNNRYYNKNIFVLLFSCQTSSMGMIARINNKKLPKSHMGYAVLALMCSKQYNRQTLGYIYGWIHLVSFGLTNCCTSEWGYITPYHAVTAYLMCFSYSTIEWGYTTPYHTVTPYLMCFSYCSSSARCLRSSSVRAGGACSGSTLIEFLNASRVWLGSGTGQTRQLKW